MRTLNFTLICLIGFFLSSCDETKKVIDVAGNVQLAGEYTVSSVKEVAISSASPTMTFSAVDKSIKGTTGCNQYFGSYALDLYALSFSDLGSTEIACEEPIMSVEHQFLNALRTTGSYAINEDILTLYSKNDRSVMIRAKRVNPENN